MYVLNFYWLHTRWSCAFRNVSNFKRKNVFDLKTNVDFLKDRENVEIGMHVQKVQNQLKFGNKWRAIAIDIQAISRLFEMR